MLERMLRRLKLIEGLEGTLRSEVWDQGDAVGAWQSDRLAAVLFPTPQSLLKVSASMHVSRSIFHCSRQALCNLIHAHACICIGISFAVNDT